MTFEQLDYFIAAVKYQTFLEAAENLNISQSTLSKQIKNLEEELELQLFDRSRRSARLTEAGELFYHEALELAAHCHQFQQRMQHFRESDRQKLRIAAPPIISQYRISSLLKDFSVQHADISLCVEEVSETELLDCLEGYRYDFIIVRKHVLNMDRHIFYPLSTDRIVVLLPGSHALANSSSVSLQDIARENFILTPPNTSLYQLYMQIFKEADIRPNILRTARLETIIGEVGVNGGISLFAEENFKMFQNPNVAAVPLEVSPELPVGVACMKSKKLSDAAKNFLRYIGGLVNS